MFKDLNNFVQCLAFRIYKKNYLCFGKKAPPSSLCDGFNVFLKFLFIYLLAPLSLCCCAGFSQVSVSGSYPPVVMCRLLLVVASFVAEHGL